ncbi:hypothetical protein Tco_0748685 [Tanacetum coccineum]|uniref:Uncharacterized protein n=1 Tax=Tanacetum coccineum TaxID=301880 RepID=A0ABQ4YWA1_9ASTR
MAQFWHTLKEDELKYRLTFMLDKKILSFTLDDFRTMLHLPQATDNNHDSFMPPPSFLEMVSFYKNELGFTMELKTSSSFKTTGLLQPRQTLCKIFSKCSTTRVTGWDLPPCSPDMYHNLKDDDIMKNIFNSGRYKDKVGMKIPAWMISEEMKHTEHYRMYVEVFGIYVPLTQSQPTESTQGTHRTPSAARRSTRRTPPALVPTIDKAYEMILQDTLHVSLAKHKSQEEQEARENVELVNEHLESLEIEKMVEGPENVIDDSSIPRNDDQNIPGTRLEPRSDKESLEVEITNDEELLSGVTGPIDQDDPHDDAHLEGENSANRQKTSEYEAHVTGESSGQVNEKEQGQSSLRNQEQIDDYDFWTESYASDDDEVPTKQVSQDIMEEVSLSINEAELKKIADEMLRQRCTSGDVCE